MFDRPSASRTLSAVPTLTVVIEQLLAPVPGGTARYASQITGALARTVPTGWRVRTTTAWHRSVAPAALDGVDGPHRLPLGNRALSEAWLLGVPPWPTGDSLHATTPLAPSRRTLTRRRGRPVVVTVHDTVPWTHPETLTRRGVDWHRRMIRRAADTADALVVPTLAVADDLGKLFPTARDKSVTIPHGVTRLDVPDNADERASRLGLPRRYVLSVATVEPRKGLDLLIAAMTGVPEIALVVAGQTGWGDLDLRRWATDAGIADRLTVLGRIDDADLAVVLNRASALVVPSRAEGFGLPALEGMAAGVAVITSDAPALVEVGGDATLVVPRGSVAALTDALRSVLGDPTLTADLGRRGRDRSKDFSWDAAAAKVWELHLSLG